jgi:hypothetical protein
MIIEICSEQGLDYDQFVSMAVDKVQELTYDDIGKVLQTKLN